MKLDLISNKAEKTKSRNENDEFYTPNYAIKPLLKYLKPNSYIWCPFDLKESNFVKLLNENGHKVLSTHIDNGEDFFTYNPPSNIDYIISNRWSIYNLIIDPVIHIIFNNPCKPKGVIMIPL